ncbi:MAG: hypothetical protein ACXABY_07285, partial [Candidatus Thorarchaeota archaeon]
MAIVYPLKRQTNRAHNVRVSETADSVIMSNVVSTAAGGAVNLWADAFTTAMVIGGGALQTSIQIGKTGQTVTLPGNLTVEGATTTISTVNLTVSDNVIL